MYPPNRGHNQQSHIEFTQFVTAKISIHDDFNPTFHENLACKGYVASDTSIILTGISGLFALVADSQSPKKYPDKFKIWSRRACFGEGISDFYTVLGLVITETDPYPYHRDLTVEQLDEIHRKILAHYAKWINIVQPFFNADPDDVMPTVALPLLLVPPTSSTNIPAHETIQRPMVVFPNLSGASKSQGHKLQMQNLNGLIESFKFSGKLSPLQLQWLQHQFTHCAETLGWLYYAQCPQGSVLELQICDQDDVMVNEAMSAGRSTQQLPTPAFLYSDRTGTSQHIPGKDGPACECIDPVGAQLLYEKCTGRHNTSRIPARYCNPAHRAQDWDNHKAWCGSKPDVVGAEPRIQAAMIQKMMRMWGRVP
ncbi:hypothetical protein C8R43DRAFT_962967 [Mycena crocata]|nr:hypothetical protein C8R43DRAFT_962967 [Mycena crocata]